MGDTPTARSNSGLTLLKAARGSAVPMPTDERPNMTYAIPDIGFRSMECGRRFRRPLYSTSPQEPDVGWYGSTRFRIYAVSYPDPDCETAQSGRIRQPACNHPPRDLAFTPGSRPGLVVRPRDSLAPCSRRRDKPWRRLGIR